MREKKKTLFVLVLLLLVGITSGYIANTYAKYASLIPAEADAAVAKWDFKEENKSQTFKIKLDETKPDVSTLRDGKIAPGTKGQFVINLKNERTDTGVDFTVKVKPVKLKETPAGVSEGAVEGEAGGATETPSTIPTNLKFYKDAARTKELVPETGAIKGKLAANTATVVPITIYWEWAFGDNDDVTDSVNVADTAAGEAANNLTIGVEITGVQTKPSENAITSGITVEP